MFAMYPSELENLHCRNICSLSCRTPNFTLP